MEISASWETLMGQATSTVSHYFSTLRDRYADELASGEMTMDHIIALVELATKDFNTTASVVGSQNIERGLKTVAESIEQLGVYLRCED